MLARFVRAGIGSRKGKRDGRLDLLRDLRVNLIEQCLATDKVWIAREWDS